MKKNIFFVFFSFQIVTAFSQLTQDYYSVVDKLGKPFHEILINKGLTLFSLSKNTGYSIEEIIKYNPTSNVNLVVGEKLYLPLKRKTIVYKILPQESLYLISKHFMVSIDSLVIWNPGAEAGIKVDKELKVKNGAVRISFFEDPLKANNAVNPFNVSEDSTITHIVSQGESLYSIAKRYMSSVVVICEINATKPEFIKVGQMLKIPLYKNLSAEINDGIVPAKNTEVNVKEKMDSVPLIKNPKIAIFLPIGADTIRYVRQASRIEPLLQFYVGTLLGMEDFSSKFGGANITYYDYYSPSVKLDSILLTEEMTLMNLVYAPMYKADAEKISMFCQAHKIPVVIPLEFYSPIIRTNPFAYQIALSPRSQTLKIAKEIVDLKNGKQIVLIRSRDKTAYELEETFLAVFKSSPTSNLLPKIIEADSANFKSFSNNSVSTWYVCFSNEFSEIKNILNSTKNLSRVQVFGLANWTKLKGINEYKNTFIYASPSLYLGKSNAYNSFYIRLRDRFRIFVNENNFRGYDFITILPKLILHNEPELKGVIYKVKFIQKNPETLHENNAGYLMRYVSGSNDPLFSNE